MNHPHTPITKRTKAATVKAQAAAPKAVKTPKPIPKPVNCETCAHWNNAEFGDKPEWGLCHWAPEAQKTNAHHYCAQHKHKA